MTATPTPDPADHANVGPVPPVPYGPPVAGPSVDDGVGLVPPSRSVAGTAGKWAIRLVLPFVIRAILRAIFR